MLDTAVRARLRPALEGAGRVAAERGIGPGTVTGVALAVGLGACVAAAFALWPLALGLWLLNRTLDGLDGAIARAHAPSDLGGFLDFLADCAIYGGFVVGVAVALPDARIACTFLVATYLLNNVALLSFASLVEKRQLAFGDERSLRFTAGLTEGTETIIAYVLFCLLPGQAEWIAYGFGAAVLFTVGQRIAMARRAL